MIENNYSLVYVADYEKSYWRVRRFPLKGKEDVKSFMKEEVRGPFGKSSWIHPELEVENIDTYTNSDWYCLNLVPSVKAVKNGKETQITGNILFLRNRGSNPEGLTVDDINRIVSSYYPEIKEIHANLCYKDLEGKTPENKQLIEIKKDYI